MKTDCLEDQGILRTDFFKYRHGSYLVRLVELYRNAVVASISSWVQRARRGKAFSRYESFGSRHWISKILVWGPIVELSKKGGSHEIIQLDNCGIPPRKKALHLAIIVFQEARFHRKSMVVKGRILRSGINMFSPKPRLRQDEIGAVSGNAIFLQKNMGKDMTSTRGEEGSVPSLPA
jgi:hypothetical protein